MLPTSAGNMLPTKVQVLVCCACSVWCGQRGYIYPERWMWKVNVSGGCVRGGCVTEDVWMSESVMLNASSSTSVWMYCRTRKRHLETIL